MAQLKVEDLEFYYPESQEAALKKINLEIDEGDFIVFCGKSGCGKTTLLRHFKPVLTPFGKRTGQINYGGRRLKELSLREQSESIGYVLQSPENQIVTDKVWHELAFGLESLGFDSETIRLRVAEMASYFGIQNWFLRNVSDLSGGQKQLLNLASVMAMHPDVLILDEPTSQLDPIAASDFLKTVKKINRDLGTTVIMTEHRLEDVLPSADKVFVMDEGEIIARGNPQEIGDSLKMMKHDMFLAMPAPMQIYAEIPSALKCPLTVRQGRKWLSTILPDPKFRTLVADQEMKEEEEIVVEIKDTWFRYDRKLPDVVRDLNLKIPKGSLYCMVGGNGTGKTTTISLISGILKAYRGKISLFGKDIKKYSSDELFNGNLGMLPQNPQSLFVKKTVKLDLYEGLGGKSKNPFFVKEDEAFKEEAVEKIGQLFHLSHLMGHHPYDLSGGEQQRLALAKIMLLRPRLLLLDEPTKGLDNYFKKELGEILKKLQDHGVTIIMVSHDIEFCALYGDQCGLFFQGNIVTSNEPKTFFSGNSFYTTAANRMSRHLFDNAITVEDVVKAYRMNR